MKKFILKILLFCVPLLLIFIAAITEDPYRVFFRKDYFPDEGNVLELNASIVKTQLYLKNREKFAYNSFIFGNSRADAFRCAEWKKYLDSGDEPFHFEGMGEGIYGVYKKIKFIDSIGDKLNNALIILDEELLNGLKNIKALPYVLDYRVSGESMGSFHYRFVKMFYKPSFLYAYYNYKWTREYKPFMDKIVPEYRYRDGIDSRNGDFSYLFDELIEKDSIAYYEKYVFDDSIGEHSVHGIYKDESTMLLAIKSIFEKHQTDYKIIISPLLNKTPMCQERLLQLNDIFGSENVYNYSGVNTFTVNRHLYYERSHYRPIVANDILREIYAD